MLPGAPHPACRVPRRVRDRARAQAYGLERRYVVSVGTLEPRKNLPTLLRAFDRLRRAAGTPTADLDLVVIGGRGWRDRELRAEIARRLASGRLHTLGYVPEEDLVRAVRRRRGAGVPVALRRLRPAGRRGDGVRDAGGRDRRAGAARGERRRGDAGAAGRRAGAGRRGGGRSSRNPGRAGGGARARAWRGRRRSAGRRAPSGCGGSRAKRWRRGRTGSRARAKPTARRTGRSTGTPTGASTT